MARITEYQTDLIEALRDRTEASAYLDAALEAGDKKPCIWPCAMWPRTMG